MDPREMTDELGTRDPRDMIEKLRGRDPLSMTEPLARAARPTRGTMPYTGLGRTREGADLVRDDA